MRRLPAFVFAMIISFVPTTALPADVISGRTKAVDADIVLLGTQRIILWGVDAPERDQLCIVADQKWACWDAAKQTLEAILAGGDATCALLDQADPFGRRHGTCTIGVSDVGESLVRMGMARAYVDQSDAYVSAEEQAKQEHLGIWQLGASIDAPWVWRLGKATAYR